MPGSIRVSASLPRLVKKKKRSYCCIFCCADIQPPVAAPLLLQVNLGKKEYSGYIGQDGFSFPVTSLRDSMVLLLYDADKEFVSKTEVKTRSIVELGSTDAVFNLDSGGQIILQLQFLLSDEDRKRIQEMRNSAVKRKQQELLRNGSELHFQDGPLRKDFPSKEDQPTLRKSLSLADLKERATSVHPDLAAPDDPTPPPPPPPGSGRNTWTPEGPVDLGSKEVQAKPAGSRLSSAVKKMISAFEGSSPQALPSVPRIKSDSSLEGMVSVPSHQPPTPGVSAQTGLVPGAPGEASIPIASADTGTSSSSGRRSMSVIGDKKPSASRQPGPSNTHEGRRRGSSRRDGAARQSMGANDAIHPDKRSAEKRRRRSMGTYSSPEQQTNRSAAIAWISHPHLCITTASRQLKDIVDLEHLNSMKKAVEENERGETEQGTGDDDADCKRRRDGFPALNGWLINQGVRGVIVVIACGAVFLNNR